MNDKALFAGGCFWCIEAAFSKEKNIINIICGYSGGELINPSYEEVCTGLTNHYESVLIEYNKNIEYSDLLTIFWQNIDPFDSGGQFYDRGSPYRTAIFYYTELQKSLAEESKARIQKNFNNRIHTLILPVKNFYPAEEYHQAYYKTNSIRYNIYTKNSKREERLKNIWKI